MKNFRVRFQIVIGLVSVLVTAMMGVVYFDVGPNEREAVMKGRGRLCESVAIDATIHLRNQRPDAIGELLTSIVERNPDLLSAALRRSDGSIAFSTKEHWRLWNSQQEHSTETHVRVPLRTRYMNWGNIELRFTPIYGGGWLGNPRSTWWGYIATVACLAFFLFWFYLGFVLRQLDPSQAVPRRVRSALNTLAEGLILTDRSGRVLLVNETLSDWTGVPEHKLIGRNADTLKWVLEKPSSDPAVGPILHFPWQAAIEREQPQMRWTLHLTDHAGRTRTLLANASPILSHDGAYRGVLTSLEDVTELEQHKSELRQAKLAADRANAAKSDFLARMSHEIRTPMNAILGYTEVLRCGLADDPQSLHRHLTTIHSSGQHLLSLINDILDLSKIEAGQMDLEMTDCDLAELLSHVYAVMKIKADEKSLALAIQPSGPLPATIRTDQLRLKQTLINLIGNAVKFTSDGGVTVTVSLGEGDMADEAGDSVLRRHLLRFDVKDTGIGMTADQLSNIFKPFSQADASISRRFGGTGLGLSICKQLAEKMGGGISVASRQGEGSTFSFWIDIGPIDETDLTTFDLEQLHQTRLAEKQQKREEVVRLPDVRVLVVDDGQSNRELASLFLRRAGARVAMASNGQEALDYVESHEVDVILMDMQMPVLDGYSASRELRARGCTTPIIALTANVMRDDEMKCREAGCNEFLTKPIDRARLVSTVAKAVPDMAVRQEGATSDRANAPIDGPQTLLPAAGDGSDRVLPDAHEIEAGLLSELQSLGELNKSVLQGKHQGGTAPADATDGNARAPVLAPELPMDDPEIRMIVELFVSRLREQLVEMNAALATEDFSTLADLAHWLKGAGGTAGFNAFTQPAKALQSSAEARDLKTCATLMEQISELVARIQLDSPAEPFVS